MKFLSVALAALVGFTDAKKTISGKDLKTRMKKGQFNKSSLMRGSKPYNAATVRKLEEQEWEINGEYSVQFNSCLSLTIADEDLFDEDFINIAKEGLITAQKSYILFDVCYTQDCYYQADDAKMTFITDVATFFQSFADFLPNQVENYCEGCRQNEDYCYGNIQQEEQEEEQEGEEEEEQQEGEEGEQGEEEGEEGEENGGERKLSKIAKKTTSRRHLANDKVVEYIDCNVCFEYECYDDENENENQGDDEVYEFEDAIEWVNGLAECQQVEDAAWNGLDLYAGLICNAEGTGVEIGVFLDNDCALYTNQKSYANIMSYADKEYYMMSQEVVEYMFTNDFSCYQPEIEYTNPYEEQEEEEEQDENEEYEAPEAAEWCQNLFGGDFEATSLYDCGVDANEEQQEEEQEEDENLYYYDWYSYQLSEQDADDEQATCKIIQSLEGEYSSVYDKENSGVMYDYTRNKGSIKTSGGKGGVIALVVLLVIGAGAGIAYTMQSKSTNDKKAPLINEGSMA